MNKSLLAMLCITLALPLSAALAQTTTSAPPDAGAKEMDGNYVLTLVGSGKEQPAKELSVVVATPVFNAGSADPAFTFAGTCTPQEGGTFLIIYTLGRTVAVPSGSNNVMYRTASTMASVRLHPGETAQIIRDGDQTYTLKVDRYKPETR